MNPLGPTPRRGFLARLAGAAAALTAGGSLPGGTLAAQGSAHDRWLTGLKGPHRCLFDFPGHGAGVPLIHVYNYVNTYRTAYGEPTSSVNAIGTFYGPPGDSASIPPNHPHYVMTRGETVVQVHGVGPFSLTYVDPADNPANH